MWWCSCLQELIKKPKNTEITNENHYKLNVIKVNHTVMAIEE